MDRQMNNSRRNSRNSITTDSSFDRLRDILPEDIGSRSNDTVAINPPRPQTARSRHGKSQDDDPVAGSVRALIPEGEYEAVCYKTSRGRSWGNTESNYINFRIYGGQYDGTELFMACRCYKQYNERHKYFEQWVLASGRRPKSGELLARKIFPGRMYRIKVRTTKRPYSDGTPKPATLQYSVVDRIIEPLTGGVS